ncbi:MAG: hypothetical protein HQL87_02945 [Magnetococcales bacterium]|nr:hypothetical protein [Magnetococcales bacterium]
MKLEEWLTALGLFAVVAVVVFAILPGGLWQTNAGRAGLLVQTGQAGLVPVLPPPAEGVPAALVQPLPPPAAPRTTRPQPGLMPFEQAAQVRFSGTIQQISELQQQDGQIHLWLNGPLGQEQHLSVAPSWYLQYMGCTLVHDAAISGIGFQFDKGNDKALIYVKKLIIDKNVCHLRNDEGFALWSNQLR